jgi:threonine dehydratase
VPEEPPITLARIRQAHERLAGSIRHTPLLHSDSFSALAGCAVYLKAEYQQVTGSFKIRGALTKMAALTPKQRPRGVVAASMGNHAQGVAHAATRCGIRSTIVMPLSAPLAKYKATQGYGATVRLFGDSLEECVAEARRIESETGATFVHAYDDWDIITGQGTLALEILADLPDADALVVPIGGGGLMAGMALAARALRPDIRLIGVQALGCAAFPAALAAGAPIPLASANTIADGIRVKQPGEKTFPIVRDLVDAVVTVDDDAISRTIVQLVERRKLVVEGAGATGLAALLYARHGLPQDAKAVAVLSGGNIDVALMGRILNYGLAASGRLLTVEVTVPDTPNQLARLLITCGERGANITQVDHARGELAIQVGYTAIRITMETRDAPHQAEIRAALAASGWPVRQLAPAPALAPDAVSDQHAGG